jgi:hypothetical protein
MKGERRGWILVAVLAALALLFALLLSIFLPDANGGPRPLAGNPRPPVGPFGGRGRGGPFFPFEELTGFWRYLAQLVSLLGVGLAVLFFLPRPLGEGAALLRANTGLLLRAFIVGLVSYAVALAIATLLASSLVGIAGLALAAVLLLPLAIVGGVVAALAIGRTLAAVLLRQVAPQPLTNLLSGLLTVFILLIIPWVGLWLGLLLAATGFGSLLLIRQNDNRTAFDEMEY